MASDYGRAARRFLVVGEVVHRLYETEDGHHRTHCGVVTREGEVVRAKRSPSCGRVCAACCEVVKRATHVMTQTDDGEEKTAKRPTKTTGRKRRGSVSGTTSW